MSYKLGRAHFCAAKKQATIERVQHFIDIGPSPMHLGWVATQAEVSKTWVRKLIADGFVKPRRAPPSSSTVMAETARNELRQQKAEWRDREQTLLRVIAQFEAERSQESAEKGSRIV